jgi:mRNA-degrading endonuclease RelE of RelBE toxin-antitoxin system
VASSGRKKRPSAKPRAAAASPSPHPRKAPKAPALPPADGDAPLHELTHDELSVFLYAALLPEENLGIVRDLGLTVPGFRTEGLSEAERCDLIADEVRAVPALRARVLDLLRNGFGRPPLATVGLDELTARDLLEVGTTEHGTVLALWRVLADPSPAVRDLARPLLVRMVEEYYGPPPAAGAGEEGAEAPAPEAAAHDEAGKLRALELELARLRERSERTQAKRDERAEKLQGQLKEARAAEARAASDAARAREAAEQARRSLELAEAALAAARGTDAAVEAQRARQEARELSGRLGGAEARAERAEAKVSELERAVAEARARSASATAVPPAAAESEEPDEAPASWLLPIYTREFYDSLEGWERRIQRAAFKQAHLLAQDHRHPSLRALPLEGLPGYYRVRVATDVRLIYRRGEQQSAVEILSLIDREDLDRYVRQAKTRD